MGEDVRDGYNENDKKNGSKTLKVAHSCGHALCTALEMETVRGGPSDIPVPAGVIAGIWFWSTWCIPVRRCYRSWVLGHENVYARSNDSLAHQRAISSSAQGTV
jgi:hypothetical protein